MTPLLWRGYFDPLELEDLGHLPEDDSSRSHYDQFLIIYQSLKVNFLGIFLLKAKNSSSLKLYKFRISFYFYDQADIIACY